jgi:tripartite-type tricarboxylate transporter receptor subunit TctC
MSDPTDAADPSDPADERAHPHHAAGPARSAAGGPAAGPGAGARRRQLAAALGLAALGSRAFAQGAAPAASGAAGAFPTRPVRLIVPFPPGGATDIVGRLLAQKMTEVWNQQVLVENKPGAGTVLGTNLVAKAPPDGYTMATVITAHVINPSMRESMPFDTVRDLSGVTQLGQSHLVLAAHPSFEAGTVAELIALAKANPGRYAYATPGSGTAMHLAMELLKTQAGIDLLHVPYKGGAPALQDVLGGRVPLFTDVLYSAMPQIRAGRLKVLALMSPRRPPGYTEYPVIAETVPGVSAVSLLGIVVPSATPRELVHRISADMVRALRSPELIAKFSELGIEPVGSSPEDYDTLIRTEIARWAPVVKASGAKAD